MLLSPREKKYLQLEIALDLNSGKKSRPETPTRVWEREFTFSRNVYRANSNRARVSIDDVDDGGQTD